MTTRTTEPRRTDAAPTPFTGTLRLGTRRSRLATTQSQWVADLLAERGHTVELVEIVTEGDVNAAPLTQIGGTGVFASALRRALHDGRIDLAVHSLKDLPVAPEPGLVVAAVPAREDPRDALCSRDGLTLEALPPGARVGTGSPRRAAQLAVRRPDLQIVPIRGNVETRLRRVGADLDAVVLACAGLARLGLRRHITQTLSTDVLLPAAGQGALALECRADRPDLVAALGALDDPRTRSAVEAERALLATLEAGCTAPIGAFARPEGQDGLQLDAFLGAQASLVATVSAEAVATGADAADGADSVDSVDGAGSGSGVAGSKPAVGSARRGSLAGTSDAATDLGRALAHRLLDEEPEAPPPVSGPGPTRTPSDARVSSADDTDQQECQT